jgi:uncharacterized protein (DUF885 family)
MPVLGVKPLYQSKIIANELGLYSDPYQYMRALSDDMLRAVRLV